MSKSNIELRSYLKTICEDLLAEINADRTTIRLDIPKLSIGVDLAIAEAVKIGVSTISNDSSLNQRDLETIRWLEKYRCPLIQSNFTVAPWPPSALIDLYGVKAQMLGPIIMDRNLIGWISVHSLTERAWSCREQNLLRDRANQLTVVLGEEFRQVFIFDD